MIKRKVIVNVGLLWDLQSRDPECIGVCYVCAISFVGQEGWYEYVHNDAFKRTGDGGGNGLGGGRGEGGGGGEENTPNILTSW
jgi:hypothetical protein